MKRDANITIDIIIVHYNIVKVNYGFTRVNHLFHVTHIRADLLHRTLIV